MSLHAHRVDGSEVVKGDTLVTFRGEEWIFQSATRARGLGHSGKVYVTRPDPNGGRDWQQEFYDNVFNVYVREV